MDEETERQAEQLLDKLVKGGLLMGDDVRAIYKRLEEVERAFSSGCDTFNEAAKNMRQAALKRVSLSDEEYAKILNAAFPRTYTEEEILAEFE